ncbi:uncharacterized protein LOC107625103 isoform X2 [Arachis ipaensis]|uniref:uncharacterized protein LOC107625103 isoform X2 n=1 Tax=Arachis ipaensis TaxID=130454 RepID=UPI000A2B2908|nr:uncharacterized protein LOC107625103 isoform X2 [Arachis ipaensis]
MLKKNPNLLIPSSASASQSTVTLPSLPLAIDQERTGSPVAAAGSPSASASVSAAAGCCLSREFDSASPSAASVSACASLLCLCSPLLLAVARKNGQIEILSPVSGDLQATISSSSDLDLQSDVVGLHLFAKANLELSTRPCTLLTCTSKGNASVKSIDITDSSIESSCLDSSKAWNVCASGSIECCKVDGSEKFALFGGKGVEVNLWDLDNYSKIWNAKSPPKDSLGIFTPTWFTSAAFLRKDDHRKFVAGTNSHQIRLYDISAQRRPVLSFDFRETPIKALAEDIDGNSIYVGNGSGDMASFDIRTGKLLGCFTGKCSGSIRSIVRHPELPVVASCGLDSYLRIWDTKTRQLLSSVFLKQHLLHVVFDSGFTVEGAVACSCWHQSY